MLLRDAPEPMFPGHFVLVECREEQSDRLEKESESI
jgi:hypothetical protein